MAQTGDDCYFFYYSKCSKGSLCPFRHQEAALGTEAVCSLWKEGRCFRPACSFRHMDIQKNRSQIPCYWEKQPGGCQKPHCVFLHASAPRTAPAVEANKESVLPVSDPLDWSSLKTMHPPSATGAAQRLNQDLVNTAKDVPSPKVEQLVINPFEEESDQESINGTPQKLSKPEIRRIVTPHKANPVPQIISLRDFCDEEKLNGPKISLVNEGSVANCDDRIAKIQVSEGQSLGIKTLEEIQREKALQSLFRNRSMQQASGQSVPSVQQTTEPKVSLKRRIVLASGEGTSLIPPNNQKAPILTGNEMIRDEIGETSGSIKLSPLIVGKTSRNVKERLGLKTTNAESRLEDREIQGKGSLEDSKGKNQASRKRSENDSDKPGNRPITERASKTDVLPRNAVKRKGVDQSSSKISMTEEPKVVIKSLDEIRREKRIRHSQIETTSGDKKKLARRTRPAMEIYQPPVRARTGISGDNPNKKITNENTSEIRTPVEDKTNETKKSDAWLHVKSFAEIMKEKREKKRQEEADVSSITGSSREADEIGVNSSDMLKPTVRAKGFNGGELKNGCGSNSQSDVLKARNDGILKKLDDAESRKKEKEILQPEATVKNCKRKFVPIVFDLGSKSDSSRREMHNPTSEPVVKQKKPSSSQDLNLHLKNSSSENVETSTPKTVNLNSSSFNSGTIKISSYVKRPEPSSNKVRSESATDKSSVNDNFVTEKTAASAPSAVAVKGRRLSQRHSIGGKSDFKAKGKDTRNEVSLKMEDEEDDFTKQLDDLMVDITCIPGEDFSELKDESQNDDELLLEIQELLS